MAQGTEMSPFVSMLFRTFLNPLKFLMGILIFFKQSCPTCKRAKTTEGNFHIGSHVDQGRAELQLNDHCLFVYAYLYNSQ